MEVKVQGVNDRFEQEAPVDVLKRYYTQTIGMTDTELVQKILDVYGELFKLGVPKKEMRKMKAACMSVGMLEKLLPAAGMELLEEQKNHLRMFYSQGVWLLDGGK